MLDSLRRYHLGRMILVASYFLGAAILSPPAHADIAPHNDYGQRLESARVAYFAGIDGDGSATDRAEQAFAALEREHPQDAVVMAYSGSLELIEAARTWAVWNKHKLATEGLAKLDNSLQIAPDNLEVRFIHGETSWHLPFFYHRKEAAEQDFAYIAPRAEAAVRNGALKPQLAAAALDRYGRILEDQNDSRGARTAYQAAVRVDGKSPGGRDASRRLQQSS